MIERQRNGEDIPSSSLKQIILSFVSLGLDEQNTKRINLTVYQDFFETAFLENTRTYYTNESKEFLAHNSVVEYVKKANNRLNEEYQRVKMYLHQYTEERLMSTCDQVLISDHAAAIQNEFQVLLGDDRQEDFHTMYKLLSRVEGGLVPIQQALQAHVEKQGMEAVQKLQSQTTGGPVDPKAYVDSLLVVHMKYSALVSESFENNKDLVRALDNGCRAFINNNIIAKPTQQLDKDSKTPELLAKYADSLLKKSSKNTGEADIDASLNGIMRIFQYLDEKDAFEKFYSRLLSKRLVNNSSTSEDAETSMVAKLKEACGYEYTNKLQRMFQDMKTSADLQNQFKNTLEKKDVDFTAYVLAQSIWPLPDLKPTFELPKQLVGTFDRFQNFYGTKHSGRKLMWLWNFCKGEIRANYPKTSKTGYTFQVSVFQIAILLPFNDADTLSFQQLKEITGLSKEYLANSLHFLLKAKVLLQNPENTEISDESNSFSYNPNFKSKKVRINLNLPLKTEQKQDTEDTQKKIQDDRHLFLQAIIVRIMKARKELTHVNLVQETLEQSRRFKPRVPDIKKTIDTLIEREYLQRVVKANNTTSYQYLA
ncbi:cullin CDC53 [Sugiyamaella lignohabitans]|uniref:Cullin CDC53 n=1 Tax=Sugiyamaella lignohabitans TaxID=796027 RepID=A0A167EW71_9ASCO|nr:cullin CDC53 [Sugiyamaella lignohabitans]ANB14535.1 cullin CDC53 [Sugiyamaella lignohabitans]